MYVRNLYVNAQIQPLGLDSRQPTLSWSLASAGERMEIQTAYRVLVSTNEHATGQEQGDVWDSGIVRSRRQFGIEYEGIPLISRKRYYWKVQIWDNHDHMSESHTSWWEMGLLRADDWSARWIGHRAAEVGTDNDLSMPLFRHEFLTRKSISRARAYICGLGQYELRINGCKVEDHVLEPGWTHYDRTCLYKAYDITKLLTADQHAVGVMLGNGFYHVTSGGRYAKYEKSFGRPKCIVQIEIEYTDGTTETIGSNAEWASTKGPITFSTVYGGEDYDARLWQSGWDRPSFAAQSSWRKAEETTAPLGQLKWDKSSPIKVMQTFQPRRITRIESNKYVFDLGQNFSGWVNIAIQGRSNSRVKIIPAELLNDDGTVNQKWTGSPNEWHYTLSGEGIESWQPRFSYSGFRYVQVEGAVPASEAVASSGDASELPILLSIEGQMIYPDIEAGGQFECSDSLLNRTHEMINWAILSNMKSVFTDCPHREKFGWLEQVHLMGPAMIYNYSIEALLAKVMDDIRDAQLPNGMVPTTAPEFVIFEEPWDIFRHSVPWGATYILNAWNLYAKYGNRTVMAEHYSDMKRYIGFLVSHSDELIIQDGLGDWYDVGEQGPGFTQNTPIALPETAMFYHIVDVIRQIAALLGHNDDAERFDSLCSRIKAAYNAAFFDPISKQYSSGSQAAQAMSLALGLVGEEYEPDVLSHLVSDIMSRGYHTSSGDVAHRFVLLALSQHNRNDVILKMSRQTEHPSYGYQIVHGATSLTEAWDGPTVGKSQNHFMLGHLEEWFYRDLAGIDYSYNPDTEAIHYVVRPYFEESLDFVKSKIRADLGEMSVEWERSGDGSIKLDLSIPVNNTATAHIPISHPRKITENGSPIEVAVGISLERYEPGWTVLQLASGQYSFSVAAD
ncbi:family 78 glycoside hydrolase catalytic domain [Cohnella cholangitidis]|uniref:alpha-L-rhamnosidase n=1 Tax=Cohnella cholangitidis TaxID=2598458 RepID=A0A7G5C0X2_9BACL|nr:family 78 glycoside hydrolase catalytic domain [Cohnella cholangitidis]QMV42856.1 Bacterial alpha-L-rhamnosidase [Cohnella cholangitidis]